MIEQCAPHLVLNLNYLEEICLYRVELLGVFVLQVNVFIEQSKSHLILDLDHLEEICLCRFELSRVCVLQVCAMIEQCAPHLVLALSPLEEIRFSHPLPTTTRMRHIDLSNPDKLLKARLKRDSTSTVGSKASNTSTSSSTLRSNKKRSS